MRVSDDVPDGPAGATRKGEVPRPLGPPIPPGSGLDGAMGAAPDGEGNRAAPVPSPTGVRENRERSEAGEGTSSVRPSGAPPIPSGSKAATTSATTSAGGGAVRPGGHRNPSPFPLQPPSLTPPPPPPFCLPSPTPPLPPPPNGRPPPPRP